METQTPQSQARGLELMTQRDNLVYMALCAESPEARADGLELLAKWQEARTEEDWLALAEAEFGKALRNGKAGRQALALRYGGDPVPVGRG